MTKNELAFEPNETITSLYKKCVSIDKNFKKIELSAIGCKNHAIDSRYCSEIDSVSACCDTADSIDTYFKRTKVL